MYGIIQDLTFAIWLLSISMFLFVYLVLDFLAVLGFELMALCLLVTLPLEPWPQSSLSMFLSLIHIKVYIRALLF
jgi:hypothetical protein